MLLVKKAIRNSEKGTKLLWGTRNTMNFHAPNKIQGVRVPYSSAAVQQDF